MFTAVSLLFAYFPGNLFDYVGSTNLLLLYILLAYAFLAGLFYYGRVTGVPIAAILLLFVAIINGFGLNSYRYEPSGKDQLPQVRGDDQFLTWLANRKDRTAYVNKDYPVYIVASAGGGMYAAMRTAYFLNYLESRCPAFAHHIFAISSVSGGALGSLAFAAQQQSRDPQDVMVCNLTGAVGQAPALQTAAVPILDRFFERDVISTIIGGALFPEMLQRIIPWPLPALDRSNAFKKALGENWRDAIRKAQENGAPILADKGKCSLENYFQTCPIHSYWDPAGDFPLLIFNATWVDAGLPIVLSDIDPQYYASSIAASLADEKSINLIDGASLSARYPIALPAGFLKNFGYIGEMRLVDGGYFDSSGLITARAVKQEIQRIVERRGLPPGLKVKVHLIYLGEQFGNILDVLVADDELKLTLSEEGLFVLEEKTAIFSPNRLLPRGSEFGAHAKALFRARDQRSAETFRLLRLIEKEDILRFEWNTVEPIKNNTDPCQNIPLAWYLAPCTQNWLRYKLDAAIDGADPLAQLQEQLTPQ